MKPNSDFLQSLAASEDPGIPYAIIAGNTFINRTDLQEQKEKPVQLEQIERLKQKLFANVVALPFLNEPNDIAVTVHSIKHIPDGWGLSPFVQEVACDHLTYFDCEVGLKALFRAIAQHH
jgi:hypothetical protein